MNRRESTNENVKATQELLRHAHPGVTLDLYARAVTPTKRKAHEKIVDDLLAAQQQVADAAFPKRPLVN